MGITGLGAIFGLGSAFCFGSADFLAQRLTHRLGWASTVLWSQLCSGLLLLPIAIWGWGWPAVDASLLAWLVGLGLLSWLGTIGLYRAFEVGVLSVVSPISASFAAITLGLAILGGDAPSLAVSMGLAVTLAGIVTTSTAPPPTEGARPSRLRLTTGSGWALMSSFAYGALLYWMEHPVRILGPLWPLVVLRGVVLAPVPVADDGSAGVGRVAL